MSVLDASVMVTPVQQLQPRCRASSSAAHAVGHFLEKAAQALPLAAAAPAPFHIQAATCSRLQPINCSCLARLVHPGQDVRDGADGGTGAAAAGAETGRSVLPSTPNNTTANLYQSQQTPPKIMIRNRNETETRLRRDSSGCGGAAELRLVSIRFKRFVQVP